MKIATQLERPHDNYSEEELEAFRFIDLKLLQEASHAFD